MSSGTDHLLLEQTVLSQHYRTPSIPGLHSLNANFAAVAVTTKKTPQIPTIAARGQSRFD